MPFLDLWTDYLRFTVENSSVSVHNYKEEDLQRLECFAENFEKLLFSDLEKVFFINLIQPEFLRC